MTTNHEKHFRGSLSDLYSKYGGQIIDEKADCLIQVISDLDTRKLAYKLRKSKPGLTPGTGPETRGGISRDFLTEVSQELKSGSFKFIPTRRIYIEKFGKKKRHLVVASPQENIVQKAMELVRTAVFEPHFKKYSQGFRNKLGAHSALKAIDTQFHNVTWFIKADISVQNDSTEHEIRISRLKKRVSCKKTLSLRWSAIKAGHFEIGNRSGGETLETSKGSIRSPRRCNIYRHEFDEFMEEFITAHNTKRVCRAQKELRKFPSVNYMDPGFIKIEYVRYADDFLIGVTGSKARASKLRGEIETFMITKLHRSLNPSKTAIKASSQEVIFLGTIVKVLGSSDGLKGVKSIKQSKLSVKNRSASRVRLTIPIKSVMNSLSKRGYFKIETADKITSKPRYGMINLDHYDIVSHYNKVVRGRLNYYSFSDNLSSMRSVIWQRHNSCIATLMQKFKLSSSRQARKKFGKRMTDPNTGQERYLPMDLKRTREFHLGNDDIDLSVLTLSWDERKTKSNLDKSCLICGTTQKVEVYDLRFTKGRRKTRNKDANVSWISSQMTAVNRKQVLLCKEHHIKAYSGTRSNVEQSLFTAGCAKLVRGRHKTKNNRNPSE